MALPNAPMQYDQANEGRTRRELDRMDSLNFKQGKDIILLRERIVLTAPDGGQWALVVDNAGALSTAAYP